MRFTKVSGIESTKIPIDELASQVEGEWNNQILELKREMPTAVIVGTHVAELHQGLLITLIYELPS